LFYQTKKQGDTGNHTAGNRSKKAGNRKVKMHFLNAEKELRLSVTNKFKTFHMASNR
jgi:hypothetical protein